jgi:hypothetical protein
VEERGCGKLPDLEGLAFSIVTILQGLAVLNVSTGTAILSAEELRCGTKRG